MLKTTLNKRLLLFFIPLSIFVFFGKIQAQQSLQSCGLSAQDARILYNDMIELRERYPLVAPMRAIAYVPVWFHLVGKADGAGRVSMLKVLDMLCEWNRIYTANGVELQFYIKGINNINNTALYNGPRNYDTDVTIRNNKKADGMNVFLVNNANEAAAPNSTILGYYLNSSNGVPYDADWFVIINAQVSKIGATTIAHEAGHFFSLSHTFLGWESCPFQPTSAAPCAPATISCFDGSVYNVENAARTGTTANCATAGDGLCDTPPDYNLGYGYSGCNYIGLACDPKGVKIDPNETNLMGYFIGCENSFSPMQKTAMQNNYLNHAKRSNLRAGNILPSATAFTLAIPTLSSPIGGAATTLFNNFTLSWQTVANATGYVVEISKSSTFFDSRTFVATTNAININASLAVGYFTANTLYYWRVKPYNSFAACATVSSTQTFKTGLLNATHDMVGISNFEVSPTPLSKNAVLQLFMTTETAFEANLKIYNIAGQLQKTEKRRFEAGFSSQDVSVSNLSNGLYILSIESEKGVLNKKIAISN
jgi:hypothetical protein